MTQLRLPFELLMACLYCNYVEHGPEKWLQNHPMVAAFAFSRLRS